MTPAFADRCLEAARSGYRYLKRRWSENSDGPTCPAYRADGNAEIGRHARMFAAAGMLLAGGEQRFRDDFEESFIELQYDPSYHHLNGFAAQLYLRAPAGDPARKRHLRERLRVLAASARETAAGTLRMGHALPLGFDRRRLHQEQLVQRESVPRRSGGERSRL